MSLAIWKLTIYFYDLLTPDPAMTIDEFADYGIAQMDEEKVKGFLSSQRWACWDSPRVGHL